MKKADDKVASFFERSEEIQKKQIIQPKVDQKKSGKMKVKVQKKKSSKVIARKPKSKTNAKITKKRVTSKTLIQSKADQKKVGKIKAVTKKQKRTKKTTKIIAKKKIVKSKAKTITPIKKNVSKKNIKITKKGKKTNKITVVINSIIGLLFVGAILFFTKETAQGVIFEKNVFFYFIAMVLVLLVSLKFIVEKTVARKKTPIDNMLIGFVLMYIISAVFSVDKWHSFVGFFGDQSRGVMFSIALVATFFIITNNYTVSLVKKTFIAIVMAVIATSFYTLMSGLALIPQTIQLCIPFSLTGSVRGVVTLLAMTTPMLIMSLVLLGNSKLKKAVALPLQMIVLTGIGVTMVNLMMLREFVSWNSFVIGLVIFMVVFFSKISKNFNKGYNKILVIIVMGLLIAMIGVMKSDYSYLVKVSPKIGISKEITANIPVSTEIVMGSITESTKQLLIGSGPATFGYNFAKFHPKGMTSPDASVQYLYQGEGLLAEGIPTIGIIGTGILLIIVGMIVNIMVSAFKKGKEINGYIVGLSMTSVIWLLSVLTGQADGGIIIIGVLILILTLFLGLRTEKDEMEQQNRMIRRSASKRVINASVIIGLLLMSISGGVYAIKAYKADTHMKQLLLKDNSNDRLDVMTKVLELMPNEGVYHTKMAVVIAAAINEQRANEEKNATADIEKKNNGLMYYAGRAKELMENDIATLNIITGVYDAVGIENKQFSEKVYKKIIELEPNNIRHYIKLGDLYMKYSAGKSGNDEVTEAIKWYNEALNITVDSAMTHSRLAVVYQQNQELDKAIESMTKAVYLSPREMLYKLALGILHQHRGEPRDMVAAEKIFKAFLDLKYQEINSLTQLGTIYERTGYTDEAKKHYAQALRIVQQGGGRQELATIFSNLMKTLERGELNIKQEDVVDMGENKDVLNKTEDIKSDTEEQVSGDKQVNEADENKNDETEGANSKTVGDEKITIEVDVEGYINVRKEGSLSGEKITTIKSTGEFKKVGENDKWVQIIIPATSENEEVLGWVHNKFVK